jgi:hypothetical protein
VDLGRQKEQFSVAWLRALAAHAGVRVLTCDVDDDSVDAQLARTVKQGAVRKAPRLDVQLKCTETDDGEGEDLTIVLKAKNYDDLRATDRHVPAVLVVVTVPRDLGRWLSVRDDGMLLCQAAFYTSIVGAPASARNDGGATVKVPRKNRLTTESLGSLLDRVGQGEAP